MYKIKEQIDCEDGTKTLILGDYIEPTYGVSCFICGKFIPYNEPWPDTKICDECKQAVAWAKEKMKEKDNE